MSLSDQARELLDAMMAEQNRVNAERAQEPWRPGRSAPVDFDCALARRILPGLKGTTDATIRKRYRELVDAGAAREIGGRGGHRGRPTHWRLGGSR